MTATSSEDRNEIEVVDTKLINIIVGDELIPTVGIFIKNNRVSELLETDKHSTYVIDNIEAPADDAVGVPMKLKLIHKNFKNDQEKDINSLHDAYIANEKDLESVAEAIVDDMEESEILESLNKLEETINSVDKVDEEDSLEQETDVHKVWDNYSNEDFIEGSCLTDEVTLTIPEAYVNMAHRMNEMIENYNNHNNNPSTSEEFVNKPSFVLIMEDEESEAREKDGYLLDHAFGVAEFYPYATPMYTDSTGELSNLFSGEYIIKPTYQQMGIAISNLMSFIIRVADGDLTALDELDILDSHIVAVREKMQEGSEVKPLSEDSIINTMVHTISNLYEATSTGNLFDLLHDRGVLEGYEDTIEMLKERMEKEESNLKLAEIFADNDLTDLFKEFEDELPVHSLEIPEGAAEGELADFYSAEINKDNMPQPMSRIYDVIDTHYFDEYDLNDNSIIEDIEFGAEESGKLFKAFVIVLAVRFNRMKQMVSYGLPFTPINVFFKTVETLYGSSFGEAVITYGILNVDDEGRKVLTTMITQGLPENIESRRKMLHLVSPANNNFPLLYLSSAARIMHALVHYIFKNEMDSVKLANELPDSNVLKEFVNNLLEEAAHYAEEDEEEAEETGVVDYETCIPYDMSVSELVLNESTPNQIAEGIIGLMNTLSIFDMPDGLSEKEIYQHHDRFYSVLAQMLSGQGS